MAKGLQINGKELGKLREERFMTQEELAEALEMTTRNLQRIEGKVVAGIGVKAYRRLTELMKPTMTAEDLSQRLVVQQLRPQEVIEPGEVRPSPDIPTFEMSVAAGGWADVTEIGEVMQPGQIDHGFFRIHIAGDSMTPVYRSGDLVEFRCLREVRGDVLEVGRDYYVQKGDGLATFKCLEKIGEGELVFRALNRKKYPVPMRVARSEIVRMAEAIFILKSPKGGSR